MPKSGPRTRSFNKKAYDRALEMFELFQKGKSMKAVADHYGLTQQRIHQIFKTHNLIEIGSGRRDLNHRDVRKNPEFQNKSVQEIAEFVVQKRREGLALTKISEISGLSIYFINKILKDAGLHNIDWRFASGDPSKFFTREDVQALYDRVKKGESRNVVAKSANIQISYLGRLFQKYELIAQRPKRKSNKPRRVFVPQETVAHLTSDELSELAANMRRNGATIRSIAEYIGRSKTYVYYALQRHEVSGVDMRTSTGKSEDKWSGENAKVLYDCYQQGETYVDIGKKYKISTAYARALILKFIAEHPETAELRKRR